MSGLHSGHKVSKRHTKYQPRGMRGKPTRMCADGLSSLYRRAMADYRRNERRKHLQPEGQVWTPDAWIVREWTDKEWADYREARKAP